MEKIPNYSNYHINEYGDILSYISGKFLNPKSVCSGGYKVVCLHRDDGQKVFERVHRLVALTFLPKIAGKDVVNHIDSNTTNNHVSNLEWCTVGENILHSYQNTDRKTTSLRGSQIHNSILNENDVKEIRKMRARGIKSGEIAKKYNIKTVAHVCDIVARRRWKHV